jgi:gas vesicle protein
MLKMAVYILVSVVFGFVMGKLYASAKNSEDNKEKDDKYNKIISDKNGLIIKQKNSIRSMQRKVESSTQGYELQQVLNEKLEKRATKLQEENRELSNTLKSKIKQIDEKDEIINLLEKRTNEINIKDAI